MVSVQHQPAWRLAVSAIVLLTGCSASASSSVARSTDSTTVVTGSDPSVRATPSPGSTTSAIRAESVGLGQCREVSGSGSAQAGLLSMGPFDADSTGPIPLGQLDRKVWVTSQRQGHDDAVLLVTDPRDRKLTQRRPAGQASASNAAQFYPGVIRAPMTGRYRIDVRVGPDTMCVLVDYHRT